MLQTKELLLTLWTCQSCAE